MYGATMGLWDPTFESVAGFSPCKVDGIWTFDSVGGEGGGKPGIEELNMD